MDVTPPCRIDGAARLARAAEEGGEKGMGPAVLPELWRDIGGRTRVGAMSQRSQEGNVHALRRRQRGRAAITPLMAKGHVGSLGKPTCTKTEQAAS